MKANFNKKARTINEVPQSMDHLRTQIGKKFKNDLDKVNL